MADTGWMIATGALCMVLCLAGVWAGVGLLTAGAPAGSRLLDVVMLQARGQLPVSVWQIVALVGALVMGLVAVPLTRRLLRERR